MIIETAGRDFRADAVAVVYLPELPDSASPKRVEIRIDGENWILEGGPAIRFLEQWNDYKALHNERFHNECQTAAGL